MRQFRSQLRSGDHGAFSRLFAENADVVFTLAHRLTGDWAVAEDVTSDTFLAAWRTRDRLELDDRPLRPWLLAIAARQSMTATRGVRRRLAFLSRRGGEQSVDDFAQEVVERIDDAAALARTARALRHLSRGEAEVLALCVWSGLTYAEAAESLGIPVGTVRSRISRARNRLRRLADAENATDDDDRRRAHLMEGLR